MGRGRVTGQESGGHRHGSDVGGSVDKQALQQNNAREVADKRESTGATATDPSTCLDATPKAVQVRTHTDNTHVEHPHPTPHSAAPHPQDGQLEVLLWHRGGHIRQEVLRAEQASQVLPAARDTMRTRQQLDARGQPIHKARAGMLQNTGAAEHPVHTKSFRVTVKWHVTHRVADWQMRKWVRSSCGRHTKQGGCRCEQARQEARAAAARQTPDTQQGQAGAP